MAAGSARGRGAKPVIALIGSGEGTVRAAARNGFETVLVSGRQPVRSAAAAAADRSLVCDYTNLAELTGLLRALHGWRPFSHVYSFTEHGQVPAATAAAALGVDGPVLGAARLARDKYQMRRWLAAAGLPATRYARCGSATDLVAFGSTAGWPVVLKVVDGTGKDGVRLVGSAAAAWAAFGAVSAAVSGRPLMVEEYHDGPEVSVETLSFEGRHRVLAVTDKHSAGPAFAETGHTMPSRLPPADQDAVRLATTALLDCLGVRTALCHTELRCTARGPRIIETHTRPGGDKIADLLRLSAGLDIYDTFFGLLAGRSPDWPVPEPRGAAVRFLSPPAGQVSAVNGVHQAERLPGVVEVAVTVRPGDLAPEPTGNASRCGHLIAVGDTAAQAAARADVAHAMIAIPTGAAARAA